VGSSRRNELLLFTQYGRLFHGWTRSKNEEEEGQKPESTSKSSRCSDYEEDLLPTVSLPSLLDHSASSTSLRWRCSLAGVAILTTVLLMILSYLYLEDRIHTDNDVTPDVIDDEQQLPFYEGEVQETSSSINNSVDFNTSISRRNSLPNMELHIITFVPRMNHLPKAITQFTKFIKNVLQFFCAGNTTVRLHLIGTTEDLVVAKSAITDEELSQEQVKVDKLLLERATHIAEKHLVSWLGVTSSINTATLALRLLPLFLHIMYYADVAVVIKV